MWFAELMLWLLVISTGIGAINLFPMFVTDGARMLQTLFLRIIKDKKQAITWWSRLNSIALLILALNLLIPFFRWLGSIG
jgi:membrane-associated protease RseP (regulator of RpoE activity)